MFVQWNQNIKSAIWSITWLIFIGSHSLGILWEYKKLFKKTSFLNTSFFKETVLKQPIKAPLCVLEEKVVFKVHVFRRMCFVLTYSARPYKIRHCQSERALAGVFRSAPFWRQTQENDPEKMGNLHLVLTWSECEQSIAVSMEPLIPELWNC